METTITRPQLEEELGKIGNVYDVASKLNYILFSGDIERETFIKAQKVEPRKIEISEVTLQRLNLIAELQAKFALLQLSLLEDDVNTDKIDKAFNIFNREMWNTVNGESVYKFVSSGYKEI